MLTFRVLIFLTIATASIAGTLRGAVGRRGGAPNSQLDVQEPTATEQAAYASPRLGRRRQSGETREYPRFDRSDDASSGEGYIYLGCYLDSLFHRVLEFGFTDQITTPQRCYEHCAGEGATLMGLQYGSQCWCGFGDGSDPTRNGVGRCKYACVGDDSAMCDVVQHPPATCAGGDLAFDLYEILNEEALATTATPGPAPATHEAYWPTNNPTPAPFTLWTGFMTSHQATGMPPSRKSANTPCADGIAGIRFGDVCCVEKCGKCGGTECATVGGSYHGAADCCTTAIMASGVSCHDSGVAPCILIRGLRDDYISTPLLFSRGDPTPSAPKGPGAPSFDTGVPADPIPIPPGRSPARMPPPPTPVTADATGTFPHANSPGAISVIPPPVAPPTAPYAAPTPASATIDTLSPEKSLLSLHNEARRLHKAKPLVYNDEVAASALVHAGSLSNSCGEFFHSSVDARSGYGENLFMCWGSESCYTPEIAMNLLYEREVEADNVSEYGIHAAQVLWKSTSDLGCSLASCSVEATPYTYLVCQYDPPNIVGHPNEEVELLQQGI